jgi:hypothetical protein
VFLEDPARHGIQKYGLMKRGICIQCGALHEIAECILCGPAALKHPESREPETLDTCARHHAGLPRTPLTLVVLGWLGCPLADANYRAIEDDSMNLCCAMLTTQPVNSYCGSHLALQKRRQ